jgi:hypothetical protein
MIKTTYWAAILVAMHVADVGTCAAGCCTVHAGKETGANILGGGGG